MTRCYTHASPDCAGEARPYYVTVSGVRLWLCDACSAVVGGDGPYAIDIRPDRRGYERNPRDPEYGRWLESNRMEAIA